MKTYIIIPAYNEEKSISNVIYNLKKEGYNDIVVIDDGSKDKTYEMTKGKGVIVLRHLINRGQGAALKTGFNYTLSKNIY